MISNIWGTFVTAAVASLVLTTIALAQSTLPSLETQNAIESLRIDSGSVTTSDAPRRPAFQGYQVNPDNLPPWSKGKTTLDSQGKPSTPLFVPNTMVLQFVPDASKESIDQMLARQKLKVVDKYPKLGAVKVEADLNKYFVGELNDNDANQTLFRGINKAIEDFKKEPIVRSATPDIVLRPQAAAMPTNIEAPTRILSTAEMAATASPGGQLDWGIKNIEADQLWNLSGAQDGVLFGVMDVGFARHEHITFLDFPSNIEVSDHGNHVAGIACGRGVNSNGLRGVLPNCFVRPRAGRVFLQPTDAGQIGNFLIVFSQVLGTMERFFDQYDDVHAFNVSLGYNWKSNFGVNPDLPESVNYRSWVEGQGAILVTALELAQKSEKVIFSAAGNDSFGLATPIHAKYASPINWASLTAREKGIAMNGIVVEAHDQTNKRAAFSNVGGNISCPGVDILSAVAHDANGKESSTSYGLMSGTSMASPYCASAYALLSLVRSDYPSSERLNCLLASTEKSDTGVPIPKLTQALAKCPGRTQ